MLQLVGSIHESTAKIDVYFLFINSFLKCRNIKIMFNKTISVLLLRSVDTPRVLPRFAHSVSVNRPYYSWNCVVYINYILKHINALRFLWYVGNRHTLRILIICLMCSLTQKCLHITKRQQISLLPILL